MDVLGKLAAFSINTEQPPTEKMIAASIIQHPSASTFCVQASSASVILVPLPGVPKDILKRMRKDHLRDSALFPPGIIEATSQTSGLSARTAAMSVCYLLGKVLSRTNNNFRGVLALASGICLDDGCLPGALIWALKGCNALVANCSEFSVVVSSSFVSYYTMSPHVISHTLGPFRSGPNTSVSELSAKGMTHLEGFMSSQDGDSSREMMKRIIPLAYHSALIKSAV